MIKDAYATTDTPSSLSKSDQQELAKLEAAKQKNNTRLQELQDLLGNMQEQHEKLFNLCSEKEALNLQGKQQREALNLQEKKQREIVNLQGELEAYQKALQLLKIDQLDVTYLEKYLEKSKEMLASLETKGVHTQELNETLASYSKDVNCAIKLSEDSNFAKKKLKDCLADTTSPITKIQEVTDKKIPPITNNAQFTQLFSRSNEYVIEAKNIEVILNETSHIKYAYHQMKEFRQKRVLIWKDLSAISDPLATYAFNIAYHHLKEFSTAAQSKFQKHRDTPEPKPLEPKPLEPKQFQQQIEALDKDISTVLGNLGLKPSKKLSQAKQIKNAEKLDNIKLVCDTKKSIRDIESKKQNIEDAIRQLTSKNTFSETWIALPSSIEKSNAPLEPERQDHDTSTPLSDALNAKAMLPTQHEKEVLEDTGAPFTSDTQQARAQDSSQPSASDHPDHLVTDKEPATLEGTFPDAFKFLQDKQLDIASIDNNFNKSKELLATLKANEDTTHTLKGKLAALHSEVKSTKDLLEIYYDHEKMVSGYQTYRDTCKKSQPDAFSHILDAENKAIPHIKNDDQLNNFNTLLETHNEQRKALEAAFSPTQTLQEMASNIQKKLNLGKEVSNIYYAMSVYKLNHANEKCQKFLTEVQNKTEEHIGKKASSEQSESFKNDVRETAAKSAKPQFRDVTKPSKDDLSLLDTLNDLPRRLGDPTKVRAERRDNFIKSLDENIHREAKEALLQYFPPLLKDIKTSDSNSALLEKLHHHFKENHSLFNASSLPDKGKALLFEYVNGPSHKQEQDVIRFFGLNALARKFRNIRKEQA